VLLHGLHVARGHGRMDIDGRRFHSCRFALLRVGMMIPAGCKQKDSKEHKDPDPMKYMFHNGDVLFMNG
jgi:hypothetical protein